MVARTSRLAILNCYYSSAPLFGRLLFRSFESGTLPEITCLGTTALCFYTYAAVSWSPGTQSPVGTVTHSLNGRFWQIASRPVSPSSCRATRLLDLIFTSTLLGLLVNHRRASSLHFIPDFWLPGCLPGLDNLVCQSLTSSSPSITARH